MLQNYTSNYIIRNFHASLSNSNVKNAHKVVVVGAGSAGMTIAHQLIRNGNFKTGDIAIIDPNRFHDYQPGWTLVGAGVKDKRKLRKEMTQLLDRKLTHYAYQVKTIKPENNLIIADGKEINYEHLVVVPGIEVKISKISGLQEALDDPHAPIGTIYSYNYCDKVWQITKDFTKGKALFTQPSGMLKCAGAPQKIMWLALDHWKKKGLYSHLPSMSEIEISFATGLHQMFGVDYYNKALELLRKERNVQGLFSHNLTSIQGDEAIFDVVGNEQAKSKAVNFDMLHVTPPMGAWDFVAKSPIANAQGLVQVDAQTLQSTKYTNIWSAGDASTLPTSKTAAAITAEAPVLVRNLLQHMQGKPADARYEGYTSCPIPTEYGKLLLAEFGYDGRIQETFKPLFNQSKPQRPFYYLKRDFFPWVYFSHMIKGNWKGPKGFGNPLK